MKLPPAGPLLLLPAVAGLLLSAPAVVASPQEELSAVHAKLEALQKDLAANERMRRRTEAALRQSDQAISAINARLAALARERTATSQDLSSTRDALDRQGIRVRQQQEALGMLLNAQYRAGEPEGIRRLLGGADPDSLHRDLGYLQYIGRERAQLLQALRDNQAKLQALAAQQADREDNLARISAAQAAAKLQLAQEQRNRQQLLAAVSGKITLQQQDLAALQKDEKRLSALVEKLAKSLPSTATAASAGDAGSPRPAAAPASTTGFERGRLRRPASGRTSNRFGAPREGGTSWRGLFFEAPAGSPVRAVAGGRVVYANWLRGFGNLMIIDHGEGLMSLYGNNDAMLRRIGHTVQAGEVLARVGNSGGSGSGLYFELRRQGVPLDPAPWLGAN